MGVALPAGLKSLWELARRYPVLTVGLLLTAIPTMIAMATQSWTQESGIHGPLVLATAIWLVWRSWDEIVRDARPGNLWLAIPVLLLAMALYIFGRAFNFLMIEVGAFLLALLAIAYALAGHKVLMKMWFPIVYLLFLVPLPGWVLDTITQPLKIFVSDVVTWLLSSIDNCISEKPQRDEFDRFIGTRPMKRFPYEIFRG